MWKAIVAVIVVVLLVLALCVIVWLARKRLMNVSHIFFLLLSYLINLQRDPCDVPMTTLNGMEMNRVEARDNSYETPITTFPDEYTRIFK